MKRVEARIVGTAGMSEQVAPQAPFRIDVPNLGDCIAMHAEMSSVIDQRNAAGDGSVGIQLSRSNLGGLGLCLYALMTPDEADGFAAKLSELAAQVRRAAQNQADAALRKAAGK